MKSIFRYMVCAVLVTMGYSGNLNAQGTSRLIQFSGVVMTSDSLKTIPFVNIVNLQTHRGTTSDYLGFFSFVSSPGDTVVFSSIGYKRKHFIIPDSLLSSKYSIIQLLTQDTFHLPETIVYPWPTPEQFKEAFITMNIPDDDLERARRNLKNEELREKGELLAMDADENQDYYMRGEAAKFYYAGQYPVMNILNPLAWAEFFAAWKRGDYKKK